jgi:hypothetical protein
MKTIFRATDKFDDPVGTWFECDNCKNEVFVPRRPNKKPLGNYFINYCPFCGIEIKTFE